MNSAIIDLHKLFYFFSKFEVISCSQHGFTKNKGTETAVFELLNEIISTLEDGEVPLALLFDLSKAFDSVIHSILLERLELNSVRDISLRFIESYLKNRQQRVVIN